MKFIDKEVTLEVVIMKKLILLLSSLFLLWSCGNNSAPGVTAMDNNSTLATSDLTPSSNIAISSNFCSNETNMKRLSTSLLSAYSAKGNGSDTNYCGGTSTYTEDGDNFNIALDNYCVNFRGSQLILNGTIDGVTDSGANFLSSIIPNLTITGTNVDLDVTGTTKYGRADDMFMNLSVFDNVTGKSLVFQDVNIKKGEFDLGYFTLDQVGPYEFKFIDHFNADYTAGMLFIYGMGEEYLILSADSGVITVVYKKDRHDPGTTLDVPSCNG